MDKNKINNNGIVVSKKELDSLKTISKMGRSGKMQVNRYFILDEYLSEHFAYDFKLTKQTQNGIYVNIYMDNHPFEAFIENDFIDKIKVNRRDL